MESGGIHWRHSFLKSFFSVGLVSTSTSFSLPADYRQPVPSGVVPLKSRMGHKESREA